MTLQPYKNQITASVHLKIRQFAQQRSCVTVLQFVCISELEVMLILNLVFHSMGVLCTALCTFTDMRIRTGADSDTGRIWGKCDHKDSEKCVQEK